MPTQIRIIQQMLAATSLLTFLGAPAHAFLFPSGVEVVEFKNLTLNHYFLASDPGEIAAVDAGAAGPGWVRTGFVFVAEVYPHETGAVFSGTVPVSRFYGTPGVGPNSHFYTADPGEAESLKRPGSGWTFEGVAFSIHRPDANGACDYSTPIHRLYNNRGMFNDASHRYVFSSEERASMVAQGWIDEGPVFCAGLAGIMPFKSFVAGVSLKEGIVPGNHCEDPAFTGGSCLSISNLPVPKLWTAPFLSPDFFPLQPLTNATGNLSSTVLALVTESSDAAAQHVFLQDNGGDLGIHIDTRDKASSPYSSIATEYQFPTTATTGSQDARFFPWVTAYAFETQLSIDVTIHLRRAITRDASSFAYGHPTIEFVDQRSGHHLQFSVLAYATMAAGNDMVAPDVNTGNVIVGTTFRVGSPYGRASGAGTLQVPGNFSISQEEGPQGNRSFEFLMDKSEFMRVLDAARTVDPALSSAPTDYFIHDFRFKNEVLGQGEIGVTVYGPGLSLIRR